ncbi:hypothetical protein [Siphonobacter sp. BAB-5385]|uniref:hypothetical protein n=1 Tax=Siphonobacter sp. BAB-5385 TaxID=1864822 RepID=UPI00113FCA56|nr:hypothetical protein [Siphonobacter sp. BAB-5385]
MKRYILAAMLTASLISCDKYLDETPNNALPAATAIRDAGTARAAINGAYSRVQSYYASGYPTLGTITTDNVIFNGTLSQYLQLDQNAVTPDNAITLDVYQSIYRAINTVNSIIAYVPAINDPNLGSTEKIPFWAKPISFVL